jgi:asparagine synthase (glutamine-hydrolysing)
MCGIAGIIGNFSTNQLDSMLASQSHRGPDATGKYVDSNFAALGHNRLAIIDLSPQSNQPLVDESGRFVLVFNGEIYNYIELKKELEPYYQFKTQSDTEVLLAAFIVYGQECLSKLNGMFAFAIWDNRDKKLFAARDRFGVKPLYYNLTHGMLLFSSEIKAIHAAGISKNPNQKVWASYFAYGSYGAIDETFWESVKQLPGGHFLEFEKEQLHIEKWYFFEEAIAKQSKNWSYDKAKKHYLLLLKDAINLRFRADVGVGFNLSGGLDSSILLALINNQNPKNNNINAYTFYTNNANYDELLWVENMIALTKNPLNKVLLTSAEVADFNNKIQYFQDEPFGGIPTLAYAKIFEQARKDNVLVLLDGQGMDEQWAGYDYYLQSNEATIQGVVDSPYKTNMLSDSFLALAQKPVYPKPFEDEILNKQYRDLFYTKIPRALRFNDRVSMAFSTELREPFLDYRLVEFAFSLPLDYKIKNGVTKFMLREIASEYLSEDLVFAPKRPLQTPQREWLADDLKAWVAASFAAIEHSSFKDWFNAKELNRELESYNNGNMQSGFHIWQCLGLSEMLKSF